MTKSARPWLFPIAISLLTLFGVFVLPFFFPPAFTEVMSVSNAAGFNNKVAAVAAALCAVVVFFCSLSDRSWPHSNANEKSLDLRPLPWSAIVGAALLVGACVGFSGWVVHVSHIRYLGDVGYFTQQIESATIFHRHLYTEVEFPYGPLLFYPTAWLYRLGGSQLSLQTCHFVLLVTHQVIGIVLLGYLANVLSMSRRWKWFTLVIFSVFTLQPILGLNYTLLRFAIPTATLVFAARRKSAITTAVLFGLGEVINLAVSPEMGSAFTAGALVYAVVQMRLAGWTWVWALATVPAGLAVFLVLAGEPYLRMVSLFAGGAFNFIVEPLPHVLLFLVALVWFVPRWIAVQWKRQPQAAVLPGACLVVSCALVPVALGRADPAHVFFNGIGIVLLSLVALSRSPRWCQIGWAVCLAATMAAGLANLYVFRQIDIGQAVRRAGREYRTSLPVRAGVAVVGQIDPGAIKRFDGPQFAADPIFDTRALQAIVGNETVATPIEITPQAEDALKRSGQYRPSFYCFMTAVLDRAAEERKIAEFNQAKWAMLPTGPPFTETNTQQLADGVLGIALPYHEKRPPYATGRRFAANLASRWTPVGTVNEYTIYRNKTVEAVSAP